MKISLLRSCLGFVVLTGAAVLAPVAGAAPKKMRATGLEIWPGQRVLVVLPLTVSEGFLGTDGATTGGTGSEALRKALVPVISPQLSAALQATGKFSITRPYKFDPLLSRAVLETRVQPEEASAFIDSPSLSSAQNVLGLLGLEQPGMVAQVVLQNLRVGGTRSAPTVQVTVRGDLYEAGSGEPFRSITVTSKPFGGLTPEERLRSSSAEAFADIAAAFVAPPTEFELPLPLASAPSTTTPGTMTGTPGRATIGQGATLIPDLPVQNPGGDPAPMMPAMPMNPPAVPQTPNGTNTGNAPIAPQLPGSEPPLGVNAPEDN